MTSVTTASRVDPSAFDWSAADGPAAEVRRIVTAAAQTDGRSPLNEATLLGLRHHGLAAGMLWVAGAPGQAQGVAQGFALVSGDSGQGEMNLVVDPEHRGRGVGRVLAEQVLADRPAGTLTAWSHGNHPAASALARRLGFDRVRDLWVMRRSLREDLPAVPTSSAFVVRPFEPGRDEQAFLEVNAAAFAHHPEQGSMTREDLDQRMAEPWFDPEGFFLAVSTGSTGEAGRLLGFHWTKVHEGDPAYGEVYVVGVSPDAQGMGLGKILTLTGLHHLKQRGLDEVILYVEADNAPAVAVYRGLGFRHDDADTDVMYARQG